MSADERIGTPSRAELAGELAVGLGTLNTARVTDISLAFPDDTVIEGGQPLDAALRRGRYMWIIDRAGPSVSVGVLRDGVPFAGAVYDGIRRWLFTACVGRGAWLNDRPLFAGRGVRAPRALIARGGLDDGPRYWRGMRVDRCHDIGSVPLRLCYVALCGVDAVHEADVSLMELAAAAPIVTEAGGMLTTESGALLFPGGAATMLSTRVAVLAGNPAIHRQALCGVLEAR
jgi:Inositol monophosphatase family